MLQFHWKPILCGWKPVVFCKKMLMVINHEHVLQPSSFLVCFHLVGCLSVNNKVNRWSAILYLDSQVRFCLHIFPKEKCRMHPNSRYLSTPLFSSPGTSGGWLRDPSVGLWPLSTSVVSLSVSVFFYRQEKPWFCTFYLIWNWLGVRKGDLSVFPEQTSASLGHYGPAKWAFCSPWLDPRMDYRSVFHPLWIILNLLLIQAAGQSRNSGIENKFQFFSKEKINEGIPWA